MVALGLLLLVLSAALTAVVVVQNTDAANVSVLGQSLSGLTLGELFAAGVVTGLVALLGLWLTVGGARRGRARRLAAKREVRDVRDERESLAEENARLQRELADARSDSHVYPTEAYPTEARPTETSGRHGLFTKD